MKPLLAFFTGTVQEYKDLGDLAPSFIATAAWMRNKHLPQKEVHLKVKHTTEELEEQEKREEQTDLPDILG
jgi:hypothetical protein